MRPMLLQLTDFGSFGNQVVPLSDLSLVAVVGENGAGKSTLLTGMTVALFGAKVGSLDGFVRQGADKFTLHFNFEVNGREYAVKREYRSAQTAELHIVEDGHLRPACEPKVSIVDAKIVELLGCGYEEFTLAHHIPQGALGAFASIDPASRKKWLMDNLPMGLWAQLEINAKADRGELDVEITRFEGTLQAYAPDVDYNREDDERMTAALAAEHDSLKDDWAMILADLDAGKEANAAARAAAAHHDDLENALNRAREAFDRAEATSIRLESDIAELESKRSRTPADVTAEKIEAQGVALQAAVATYEAAEKALNSADTDLTTAVFKEQEAEKAAEEYAETVAPTCPTCGQRVEGQSQARVQRTLEEHVVVAKALSAGLRDEILGLRDERDAALDDLGDPALVEFKLAELRTRLTMIRQRDSELALLESKRADRLEVGAERDRAIGLLRDAFEDAERAHREMLDFSIVDTSHLEAEAERIGSRIAELVQQIALDEARIDADRRRERDFMDVTARLATMRVEFDRLTLLVKAYGKNGIPARIIEGSVAEIENHTNAFLERFTDGLSVGFITQRENKSGGLRETLEIVVTDASGTRPLERFSGGERTRVHFALSVGLSQFLAAHTGDVVASFVVDEPEYLDTDGVTELVSCLHALSASVPFVALVSHIDGIADTIPQRIEVAKGSQGSTVEVTA